MKTSLRRFARAVGLCTAFSLVPSATQASDIVVAVPGNTIVQDADGDLMPVNCNPSLPNRPCSLPASASPALPAWQDIKTARIHQVGGRVDFSIATYGAIPATPPVSFLAYFWQFQDGCVHPSPTNKDGVRVLWDGDMWMAHWYTITSCSPRTIEQGAALPLQLTDEGVRVRASIGDLLTELGSAPLVWFAGVRRMPFIHPVFTSTVAVDVAPDVFAFNPTPPPAFLFPEDSATWEPR